MNENLKIEGKYLERRKTMTMKAAVIHELGDVDVLKYEDIETTKPGGRSTPPVFNQKSPGQNCCAPWAE